MKKISFVIPCYNSEKTISNVVNEIRTTVQKRGQDKYEIILVNDCSKDNVWDVIKNICNQDKNVKGICFAKILGSIQH